LIGGPRQLTIELRCAETGLGGRGGDQFLAMAFDGIGQRVEQRRPAFAPIGLEGGGQFRCG
jgi:hypothetical protein